MQSFGYTARCHYISGYKSLFLSFFFACTCRPISVCSAFWLYIFRQKKKGCSAPVYIQQAWGLSPSKNNSLKFIQFRFHTNMKCRSDSSIHSSSPDFVFVSSTEITHLMGRTGYVPTPHDANNSLQCKYRTLCSASQVLLIPLRHSPTIQNCPEVTTCPLPPWTLPHNLSFDSPSTWSNGAFKCSQNDSLIRLSSMCSATAPNNLSLYRYLAHSRCNVNASNIFLFTHNYVQKKWIE